MFRITFYIDWWSCKTIGPALNIHFQFDARSFFENALATLARAMLIYEQKVYSELFRISSLKWRCMWLQHPPNTICLINVDVPHFENHRSISRVTVDWRAVVARAWESHTILSVSEKPSIFKSPILFDNLNLLMWHLQFIWRICGV